MKSQVYIDSVIRPIINPLRNELAENFSFMDDNARPHRPRTVQIVLEQGHITLLPWPANLPDHNAIKNMWDFVQYKNRRISAPQNSDELIVAAVEEWNNKQETINRLIVSMHCRVNMLLNKRGDHTDY